MVNELGVDEGGGDVKEERVGVESVALVGVDVGIIVLSVKDGGREDENWLGLGSVMEDDGPVKDEMLGEIEDTELELISDEGTVTEGDVEDDTLGLNGDTVEDDALELDEESVEEDALELDGESVELELGG